MREGDKLGWVNAVRGVAILMVMAVHTSQRVALPNWALDFFACGAYGVQLFFIASAFTILRSYRKRMGQPGNVSGFFVRRFFRIAPLFYVGILVYGLAALYAGHPPSPFGVLLTATFLHEWSPSQINAVVPGGWSIGVEFAFYALVPLLALMATSLWRSVGLFALSLILGLGLRRFVSGDFATYWLPNQLPAFALGFVLYWAVESKAILPRWLTWAFMLATPLVFASHLPMARLISCVLMFGACLGVSTWPRTSTWLERMGVVSFSGYIWHFTVIAALWLLMPSLNPWVQMAVLYALTVVLTFGVSSLSYRWVEEPGIALGKRLLDRKACAKVIDDARPLRGAELPVPD